MNNSGNMSIRNSSNSSNTSNDLHKETSTNNSSVLLPKFDRRISRDYSKKEWTSTQKIVDRLCEYGILAVYNSSTIEEYKSMLAFIESVETNYYNNM